MAGAERLGEGPVHFFHGAHEFEAGADMRGDAGGPPGRDDLEYGLLRPHDDQDVREDEVGEGEDGAEGGNGWEPFVQPAREERGVGELRGGIERGRAEKCCCVGPGHVAHVAGGGQVAGAVGFVAGVLGGDRDYEGSCAEGDRKSVLVHGGVDVGEGGDLGLAGRGLEQLF